MRQLAALLSMLIALSASAAEMWRWKDADGVVHYSDRPVPGAERIEVLSSQKTTGESAPQSIAPPRPAPPPPPPPVQYTNCSVVAPLNDQVFFGVNSVNATIAVEPLLQPGNRLQVLLNGLVDAEWPAGTLVRTYENLYRGTYTLEVRVLDASGRPLCLGAKSRFHIRQPSVLAPNRKPPPKKKP